MTMPFNQCLLGSPKSSTYKIWPVFADALKTPSCLSLANS